MSMVIAGLDAESRKTIEENTVCSGCQNSMWTWENQNLNCFCRIMGSLTWNSIGRQERIACDGTEIEMV